MRTRAFPALAQAALATWFVVVVACAPATAEEMRMDRSVTVTGSASVEAVPDVARVTSGLVSEAKTAREAVSANNATMSKLIIGLKAAGIAARDIATRSFQVEPRYVHDGDGKQPRMDGYQVSNEVVVTVHNLAKLGNLLDEIVTLGANRVSGLSFEVSEADKLKDEARGKAVADARRKAEIYAKAAGAEIGPVLAIAEDGGAAPPRPYFSKRAVMAESVPVERGSQSLEAQVTVTWGLK